MPSETAAGLTHQIEVVIKALELIRTQLSQPASDPDTGLASPKVPPTTVARLKMCVDQVRLFLWAYLDTWAMGGSDPLLRVRDIRVECATDLLARLANDLQTGSSLPLMEAERLREQLHTVEALLP